MDKVLTGFHGKLPVAGDFLSRGLPSGFVQFWDGWATRHLIGKAHWPHAGLRLRLASAGRAAAGVVLPGADRVGRRFPLAAFVIAPSLPSPAALELWCDAVTLTLRAAQDQGLSADALDGALAEIAAPQGATEGPPFQLWIQGHPAQSCAPEQPQDLLQQLFSCC
ncbi:type VI secretion system-associated protein TagF [Xinfangfangia sp. CPCC 101601]|uniref:Type VI secretion system-associated protein TagF n=1 Tax=Pseudogemmobacter lacusdianii TaxID=3069608 RepID=A0ABU0VXR6_9RHOB|nr:type VI secretion system-associated protein TagF [Xinfangfangia sp. CPCC 101601]MDQ2065700.1 type VI secretion system-associated protein TagF [Xinfangfangia sp. CPCC 101601]